MQGLAAASKAAWQPADANKVGGRYVVLSHRRAAIQTQLQSRTWGELHVSFPHTISNVKWLSVNGTIYLPLEYVNDTF